MTNTDVARAFNEIANLMEIKGEDTFRVSAYRRVARAVATLGTDINKVAEQQELETLEGVGASSAARINELLQTGHLALRAELLAEVPETLLKLLDVPTLGPKKVAQLWRERDVTSLDTLKAAVQEGRLDGLRGFGAKSLEHILRGIAFLEQSAGRTRLGDAWQVATRIRSALMEMKGVRRVARAGSLRRGCELVGNVDLICVADKAEQIIRRFTQLSGVVSVVSAEATKGSILVEIYPGHNLQVDLHVVPEKSFGAAWQYFTGSKTHNNRLRELAARRGCTLNEYGLTAGYRVLASRTEEEIYKELCIPWMPPELREDRGEFSISEVPDDLLAIEHIRGDLHMHTTESDGRNSLEEMVAAAKSRGYEYVCITEHSQSSAIANGLSIERLRAHIRTIRALARQHPRFTIWIGAEVDILSSAKLDYPDSVLAELDFVIGSIHTGLGHDIRANTRRTLAAIRSPYINCIGHPTGRLLNERDAMPLDIEAICAEAARTGTALELNANAYRLDLSDHNTRVARDLGATVAINTDAHSVDQFEQMHLGVLTARRAWLRDHDVLNTRTAREVATFVARKRPNMSQ
jgi:DNA polymerase (family X)